MLKRFRKAVIFIASGCVAWAGIASALSVPWFVIMAGGMFVGALAARLYR